jgi:hypothetical protein
MVLSTGRFPLVLQSWNTSRSRRASAGMSCGGRSLGPCGHLHHGRGLDRGFDPGASIALHYLGVRLVVGPKALQQGLTCIRPGPVTAARLPADLIGKGWMARTLRRATLMALSAAAAAFQPASAVPSASLQAPKRVTHRRRGRTRCRPCRVDLQRLEEGGGGNSASSGGACSWSCGLGAAACREPPRKSRALSSACRTQRRSSAAIAATMAGLRATGWGLDAAAGDFSPTPPEAGGPSRWPPGGRWSAAICGRPRPGEVLAEVLGRGGRTSRRRNQTGE